MASVICCVWDSQVVGLRISAGACNHPFNIVDQSTVSSNYLKYSSHAMNQENDTAGNQTAGNQGQPADFNVVTPEMMAAAGGVVRRRKACVECSRRRRKVSCQCVCFSPVVYLITYSASEPTRRLHVLIACRRMFSAKYVYHNSSLTSAYPPS